MSTTIVSMHANLRVQPHPLYSLAGAVLGTALVCAFLLWAFTHPLPLNVVPRFVMVQLTTFPAVPPKRVVRTFPHPVRSLKHSNITQPVVIPKTSALQSAALPAALDLSLPESVFASPAASTFIPHAFDPYSDLSHALNAPPPPTMQDGDSYRSVYGLPVVKSGGRCLAPQTIQVGPSPSAHTTIGFGVPCPGEYRPSMADELKAWADKQAGKNLGPP